MNSRAKSTFYSKLTLEPTATLDEIKHAFKELALKYHPDKSYPGLSVDEQNARFIEITTAYHFLIDPIKKAAYDERLRYTMSMQSSAYSFNSNEDSQSESAPEAKPASKAKHKKAHHTKHYSHSGIDFFSHHKSISKHIESTIQKLNAEIEEEFALEFGAFAEVVAMDIGKKVSRR